MFNFIIDNVYTHLDMKLITCTHPVVATNPIYLFTTGQQTACRCAQGANNASRKLHAYNHSKAIFSNWFENILMVSDSITEGGNSFQSTIVLG